MAPQKKLGKTSSTIKPSKPASKVKPSGKNLKVSKGHPKKVSPKAGKPKASKKVPTKSITKGSGSSTRKPKSATSSQKVLPASPKKPAPITRKPAGAKKSSVGMDAVLSNQDRYNVGGLCACVIDTSTNVGEAKLRRVLTRLQLTEMDQANLYRVSQGVRIPKLFADQLHQDDNRQNILQWLTQFAKADDSSGKQWVGELAELNRLLGS